MSDPSTWRQLLDDAAAALTLEVVAYCDELNSKRPPLRYFHADARAPGDPSLIWRLKVVNSGHAQHASIQDCNHYNNCVHRRLAKSTYLQAIIDIPACWAVPADSLKNISCSELVEGCAATTDDLELLVDALVQLKSRRTGVKEELGLLRSLSTRSINSYGHQQYRDRLCYSLKGLIGAEAISTEFADAVLGIFDHYLSPSLGNEDRTFAHGDFSLGNLRVRKGKLVLLDFEHSHIGLGEIDLAHMFVNLTAQCDTAGAFRLVELFEEGSAQEGMVFDTGKFQALLLERIAGKMNSMSAAEGEKWERLKAMLAAYVTG
jgi:hypothetical protein